MRLVSIRTVGGMALASVLALTALATLTRAEVSGAVSDDLLGEQLAAGEFTSALDAAGKISDPAKRNQCLVRIAGAQARSGDRSASYNTLASVDDDLVRTSALKENAPGHQGGFQPNFQDLMDLISTTVAPTTWDEVGGPGSMREYRTGVYVDAEGVVRRAVRNTTGSGLAVARLEAIEAQASAKGEKAGRTNTDPRVGTDLRKVSLTRLEKQVQLRMAAGRQPTEDMLALAGLEKIKYVFVYPETGDVVLAGPAGGWRTDEEGRVVSQTSGRPIVQLDDLVVVLRHLTQAKQGEFGCSINPREDALAETKDFIDQSAKAPLKEGTRGKWLKQLRDHLGKQDIVVDGIDPHTRVAQVLVEADYRMKLVGMGLEPGVAGVQSYLSLIKVPRGEAPPPLDVLRWWFTLNEKAIQATQAHDAFELAGHSVRVQSENEMLSALGRRVHTGKTEPLNQQFAESFSAHFAELAAKYPVYADLENMFDLALVGALIKSHDLQNQIGWHLTCFGDPSAYPVAMRPAPKTVETVINHRVVNQVNIIAGVSGGVSVNPWAKVATDALKIDRTELPRERTYGTPSASSSTAWWWD